MHLGVLTRGMHDLKLLGSSAKGTFEDFTFVEVAERLSSIKSPRWCALPGDPSCSSLDYKRPHVCPGKKKWARGNKTFKLGAGENLELLVEYENRSTVGEWAKLFAYQVKDKLGGLRLPDGDDRKEEAHKSHS